MGCDAHVASKKETVSDDVTGKDSKQKAVEVAPIAFILDYNADPIRGENVLFRGNFVEVALPNCETVSGTFSAIMLLFLLQLFSDNRKIALSKGNLKSVKPLKENPPLVSVCYFVQPASNRISA